MLQGSLKIILQNLAVEVLIHLPINLAQISNPFPGHTTPYHDGTSTKLEGTIYCPVTQALSRLFHTHFRPSEPNLLILDSSDHISLFQSATVQSLWAIAKSSLSLL